MRSSSLFQSIPALLVQLDDGALCMLVTKLSNLKRCPNTFGPRLLHVIKCLMTNVTD